MAHTPDHLTLTITWDHPGLAETLEGIIAKAWAAGFRDGVNKERRRAEEGGKTFGAPELAALYRDWRGYGPGVQFPGGAFARARIVAEDKAEQIEKDGPTITREVFEQAMRDGQVKTYICIIHRGLWPCAHQAAARAKRIDCVRGSFPA